MPSFPTLAVRNLMASTHWYQEVLNFKLVFEIPGSNSQPILTHLRWAKYADLLLVPDRTEPTTLEPKGLGVTFSFRVSEGSIDYFAEDAMTKGANVVAVSVDQPWGVKEVAILDPDGYCLVFFERIKGTKNGDL